MAVFNSVNSASSMAWPFVFVVHARFVVCTVPTLSLSVVVKYRFVDCPASMLFMSPIRLDNIRRSSPGHCVPRVLSVMFIVIVIFIASPLFVVVMLRVFLLTLRLLLLTTILLIYFFIVTTISKTQS